MVDDQRDYWATWKQFVLHGVMQEETLPPSLVQSWRRCAALALDPYGSPPFGKEADAQTHAASATTLLTDAHTLLSLVRPAMEDLHQFAEGSECVVIFADAAACILEIVGDRAMQRELEHLGLAMGASWSEAYQGSNALALALGESFPIQLEGAMHYRAFLHPFYTSAAPVHDFLGQTIGVLAVIGRHEHSHPHTLGMITAAAQALSNQLQMQVWLSDANALLIELRTILQTIPEGIVLLRTDGVISQMNAPAATMLGLVSPKVTGRRLRDVLPLPGALVQAFAARQALSYEELIFDTIHGRVPCLCTLQPIASYQLETGLEGIAGSVSLQSAQLAADGFILILRSIERVQKLVNRMTGAHARLTFANVIGENAALKEAMRLAHLASRSNSTVLLRGETGTGKEIFAQSIHTSGGRANGPFIAINCAAIPRELISTELFGYEGGAFTGADRQGRPGKFEQASGGTLFLDEIGDMPLDLQTSLLRAIETRTIIRVGGQRVISADVRIIAATHRDLHEEAQRGNFRSDLYYRLNVLTITIPPLRERRDDVPLLVHHFLQRQSRILGRSLAIMPEALTLLERYNWPGNVRELENVLERVTYLMPSSTITLDDLPVDMRRSQEARQPAVEAHTHNMTQSELALPQKNGVLKQHSRNAEVETIAQALQASNNSMSRAAAALGISRTTLWRKMLKYRLAHHHETAPT